MIMKWTLLIALLHLMAYPVPVHSSNDIHASPDAVRPLLVGASVPDVTVKNMKGKSIHLKKLLSKGPSVLIFYRGSWCMYCNRHFNGIRKVEKKLSALGYRIIAISPDKLENLAETLNKHEIGYTLLSDSPMEAAKAFGIAFRLDDKTAEKYKTYDIDLERASGMKHQLLPVPSVFLINKEGIIQFQYVNPDYKIRLNPDVLLALAKAALPKTKPK